MLLAEETADITFLLTPLREGRQSPPAHPRFCSIYFYSRPCVRGDSTKIFIIEEAKHFYSRPCVRGDGSSGDSAQIGSSGISTHAPA